MRVVRACALILWTLSAVLLTAGGGDARAGSGHAHDHSKDHIAPVHGSVACTQDACDGDPDQQASRTCSTMIGHCSIAVLVDRVAVHVAPPFAQFVHAIHGDVVARSLPLESDTPPPRS